MTHSDKISETPNTACTTPQSSSRPATRHVTNLKLLLSQAPRSSRWTVIAPAVLLSIGAGLVPPFMTQFIGDATQAFTQYAFVDATIAGPENNQIDQARRTLISSIQGVSIRLAILGAIAFVLATSMVALWVVNGERIARALRLRVYATLSARDLAWFDLGMAATDAAGPEPPGGDAAGSGGLMGRFTKDTDDVRIGSSQALGLVVQYLTTFIACLVLSFWRSWQLTLVILASFPVVTITIAVTERILHPLLLKDRDLVARSTGRLERAFSAIATVKAFNAEDHELSTFKMISKEAFRIDRRMSLVLGLRNGLTDFITLAMFVQGFWFGSYLVSSGRNTVGEVNTAFWACLSAATNVQLCVPMLVIVEKAKVATASLLDLLDSQQDPIPSRLKSHSPTYSEARRSAHSSVWQSPVSFDSFTSGDLKELSTPTSAHVRTPSIPTFVPIQPRRTARRSDRRVAPRALRKIRPDTFSGEMALRGVTFHYPTRPAPAPPALDNVSLYLPAKETTYIVGGSGSGKSTVASLLLGLYKAQAGSVEVDEQAIDWIDHDWLRGHVASVSQGASLLIDGTVHDNVACGAIGQLRPDGTFRQSKDVTRAEVEAACRGALMHEFIRDLRDGYDTPLSGEKGASLSGGQRQRLAIARAWIRDPTVLILDEATSALDPTSRLLVNEAVKRWRRNRTTIVITHDLTPIEAQDFVYVLKDGRLVEQGYRQDLEAADGPFQALLESQTGATSKEPGMIDVSSLDHASVEVIEPPAARTDPLLANRERSSVASVSAAAMRELLALRRTSILTADMPNYEHGAADPDERPQTLFALEQAAALASIRRPEIARRRRPATTQIVPSKDDNLSSSDASHPSGHCMQSRPSFKQLAHRYFSTLPNKPLLVCGLLTCLVVSACTPVFAYLLAKLMSSLGNPNPPSSTTTISLLVLLVALIQGMAIFAKFYMLERCAMGWVVALRQIAADRILKQDKAWFDDSKNTGSMLAHSVIKDTHDARSLVSTILGQSVVVVFMLALGLAWAFSIGWELTLVGLGLAPLFVVFTRLQASKLSTVEARNRALRAEVSTLFHRTMMNVRAIRSMSLSAIFADHFQAATARAYDGGLRAAPFTGMGAATATALTLLAEAVMFFVGAVLIVHGRYTYARMMEVFAMVILTITFAAQVMVFLPGVARSVQAAIDFKRFLDLPRDTHETHGHAQREISGQITFQDVTFAYPSRAHVPVLRGASFDIKAGDFVGIVGPSGGGKSTIISILQRLYEPSGGRVELDNQILDSFDTRHLRDHIGVVSQYPTLFDMTVSENIAFGADRLDQAQVERAARQAHVHDAIASLPQGYDTVLGEGASLISGGQAQRLQIARALYRSRQILLLDECTSALDAASQQAVMDTIMSVKHGRTTLMITHKLDVMTMCDYLLVVSDGRVVEQGSVATLKNSGGVFAQLANSGEWTG
ncbi:ATP-dependent permease [Microbotryomycetes sp. JL201]|nr:ATP-dependent permease [Microbotryomycetes sp. JL201]